MTETELRELIEGCAKKNTNAQRKLYEHYAAKMLSVCTRYTCNSETAHDVLHDGFIKLFDKINKYEFRGSFDGWIRRFFVNICIEHIRKENRKPKHSLDDESRCFQIEDETTIPVYEKMSADELLKYITKLPKINRTVFNMHAIEGYTHEEIAELLKISSATIRSAYYRARFLLKEMIENDTKYGKR